VTVLASEDYEVHLYSPQMKTEHFWLSRKALTLPYLTFRYPQMKFKWNVFMMWLCFCLRHAFFFARMLTFDLSTQLFMHFCELELQFMLQRIQSSLISITRYKSNIVMTNSVTHTPSNTGRTHHRLDSKSHTYKSTRYNQNILDLIFFGLRS